MTGRWVWLPGWVGERLDITRRAGRQGFRAKKKKGRVYLGVPRVVWISSSGFSNRKHGCYECSIEYGRILGIRYAINESL